MQNINLFQFARIQSPTSSEQATQWETDLDHFITHAKQELKNN